MKRKYLSILLAFSLLLAVCAIPAAAYVSDKDRASGNAAAIQKATDDYNAAAARGDTAGMAAAHAAAEAARNASGYSGGSDGTGSSGSSSSSGGSSSGRSSGGSSSGGASSGGSSSGSGGSTADKTQQMAENSAAWYVAKSAYDAAVASGDSAAAARAQSTMNNLHDKNTALANDIAGSGGSVSYDAVTGVTTITTRDGTRISNADGKSQDGSTIGMTYQISGSEGRDSVSSTQFSEEGIQRYLNAGGDVESLIAAYNQTAKEVAENWKYGEVQERCGVDEELNIVKQWFPNLSSAELNNLKASLESAKFAYDNAYNAYELAKASGDTAGMQAALDAMHAANAAAEDARGKVGYSGNSSVTGEHLTDDGGFFGVGTRATGTPSRDGTGVVTFSKTHDIVAAVVGGGSITPSGTTHVPEGNDQSYTMAAGSGWVLSDVTVDGVSVGAPASYAFSNVTASHTITATFVKKGVIAVDNLVLTDSLGVDLRNNTIKSGYGVFAVLKNVTFENVDNISVKLAYNFGDGKKTVTMQSSGGNYELPVNAASPTGAKCIYIPVAAKDGSYTITATASGTDVTTGELLTASASGAITVKGNMYEDDFTGNSSRH